MEQKRLDELQAQTVHQVENGEESLVWARARTPMRGSTALVPGIANDAIRAGGVVVRLFVVRREVACGAKPFRESSHVLGQRDGGTHVVRAKRRWITARDQAIARGRTHRSGGECVGVLDALDCQAIEVGCDRSGVAIASERRAQILRSNPQNIRPLRRNNCHGWRK